MTRLQKDRQPAHAFILDATGMDELDMNILILESGCAFAESIIEPNPLVSEATARRYQMHMYEAGFFDWYVYQFYTLEVQLWKEWSSDMSVMSYQSKAERRRYFLEEVAGMRIYSEKNRHMRSFDGWLNRIGHKRVMQLKAQHEATQPVQ